MNTRRLIAIMERSMKEHTQQLVTHWIDINILNPLDYEDRESEKWSTLLDHIFDRRVYSSRNIFPTPDLIIRCLNFIKETELSEFGELTSFQDPADSYNIENIFRNTAFLLIEFEIIDILKNWVIECFPIQEYEVQELETQ